MSDWEDLCEWMGVANDETAVDEIVDYINRSNAEEDVLMGCEPSGPRRKQFDTFKQAMHWAKNNPGEVIIRSPDGNGFIEK